MQSIHLGLTSLLLATTVCWAGPATTQVKVAGIYSDLAYNAEGGDLLGIELLVIPAGAVKDELRWNAFFQLSEGEAPYCTVVSLVVRGTKVEFTLPPGGALGGQRYTGIISSSEIALTTPSGQIEHLRRGKSYWQ